MVAVTGETAGSRAGQRSVGLPVERARAVAPGIATRAAQHDRDGSFPFEDFDDLFAADLLNLTVAVDEGGVGAGLADAVDVLTTIGGANASTGLVLAMQYLQHANVRRSNWPAPVRAKLIRSSLDGVALINALRVEPDLGTPARGGLPATTARQVGDEWRVTGHKQYVTGIPGLRWLNVWARTDEDDIRVGMFLVPSDAPGISVVETWDHLGMRATVSHDVVFDDTPIPLENAVAVAAPGTPLSPADIAFMPWNALAISAVYHGVALAARDWLVGYLHARIPSNLGAPLASLARFQSAVGEIESLLIASSALLRSTAVAIDAGESSGTRTANIVKLTVTGNAIRSVELGLALIGNPGLSRHNPLERYYRDVLCSRIHTPQDDTILTLAGRSALRL